MGCIKVNCKLPLVVSGLGREMPPIKVLANLVVVEVATVFL